MLFSITVFPQISRDKNNPQNNQWIAFYKTQRLLLLVFLKHLASSTSSLIGECDLVHGKNVVR